MAAESNLYLLEKRIGNNSELRKYINAIDFAITQSKDIFEFSRLYEKIGAQQLECINVAKSFDEAVKLAGTLNEIEVINECQDLDVTADSLLTQLFYNFIDNTLKHGKKTTLIRLYYIKESDATKLVYEDDGVGIPEANKTILFTEGFSTSGGTGLGLPLIKK